jgi:HAMP domain-containing protein
MAKNKKKSLAKSFSTVSLIIILVVKFILCLVFYNTLRSVVIDLTEVNAEGNVAHSQDLIVSILKEYEQSLIHASVGLTHFFKQQSPSVDAVSGYLFDVKQKMPASLDIYFTNNNVWNSPGGFAAFGSRWIPDDNWDNTARSWFMDAKRAGGRIAYSEPYVDSETGNIVVTLSKTVFNDTNDIGVIAYDVTVNNLRDIINSLRSYPGQEFYIINSEGLFITYEDINCVMEKNFFDDKNTRQYREPVLTSNNFNKFDKENFIYSTIIPQTDWRIISVIPAYIIFARLNVFITWLFIFTVVMFLCISVITIVFTHKNITVPLADMLNVTNALAKNDYNVNITKFRNDEIGDIQQVLVKIRDNLKSNIDSLQEHIKKKDIL